MTYDPVGDGPPYVNLTAGTDAGDCAGGACADTSTVLEHDPYGNVTFELDTAAGSGLQRETTTAYLYDAAAWLHHQPRLTQVYAGQPRGHSARPCQPDLLRRRHQPRTATPRSQPARRASSPPPGSPAAAPGYGATPTGTTSSATRSPPPTPTATPPPSPTTPPACSPSKPATRSASAPPPAAGTAPPKHPPAPPPSPAPRPPRSTTRSDGSDRSVGPTGIVTTTQYDFTATGTTTFTTSPPARCSAGPRLTPTG